MTRERRILPERLGGRWGAELPDFVSIFVIDQAVLFGVKALHVGEHRGAFGSEDLHQALPVGFQDDELGLVAAFEADENIIDKIAVKPYTKSQFRAAHNHLIGPGVRFDVLGGGDELFLIDVDPHAEEGAAGLEGDEAGEGDRQARAHDELLAIGDRYEKQLAAAREQDARYR